jgi:hypothetical protein
MHKKRRLPSSMPELRRTPSTSTFLVITASRSELQSKIQDADAIASVCKTVVQEIWLFSQPSAIHTPQFSRAQTTRRPCVPSDTQRRLHILTSFVRTIRQDCVWNAVAAGWARSRSTFRIQMWVFVWLLISSHLEAWAMHYVTCAHPWPRQSIGREKNCVTKIQQDVIYLFQRCSVGHERNRGTELILVCDGLRITSDLFCRMEQRGLRKFTLISWSHLTIKKFEPSFDAGRRFSKSDTRGIRNCWWFMGEYSGWFVYSS